MNRENCNLAEVITTMIRHGAKEVSIRDLFNESVLTLELTSESSVSRTCIRLEEFMSSAARNCRNALSVIAKIDHLHNRDDIDLLTALKKYVEDTCEAIKVVGNEASV